MCIACEWAEQASLMEKWRESRALRALKDEAEPEPETAANEERFPAERSESRDPEPM